MSPTRYTVVAADAVNDELATIWLNNPSERRAIERASNLLESALRQDAAQKGTPSPSVLYPLLRHLDHHPLRVYFEVSEPDRLVHLIRFQKL